MLASLHDAALKHLCGKDSLIYPDQTPLSRISLRAFNELSKFLYPYINPIFCKKGKDYEVRIDRSVKATRQRPDFSCTVDGDVLQSYIMDLRFDDLYRSWPFLTSRLVIDEPILPLIESNFIHFATREVRIPNVSEPLLSKHYLRIYPILSFYSFTERVSKITENYTRSVPDFRLKE
ncbi:unnamed protein product [Rhizophagus irregularis]|nr:unnamed protein product [Rhizophagus irregularis]CAB5361011.1 unnamed protein product [Rhizophagus irregularis]